MKTNPLIPSTLLDSLLAQRVPKEYQHRFRSHFAVVRMIRDYETDLETVFNWLAYELQSGARPEVVKRLYQRYNRLRNLAEYAHIESHATEDPA